MKKKIVIGFALFLIIVSLISINGCTAIGFGLGSYMDKKAVGSDYPFQSGFDSLKLKDKLSITLKDGSIKKGKFSGLTVVNSEDFKSLYSELLQENHTIFSLPAIGDTLTIFLKPAKKQEYMERTFSGFTFDSFQSGNYALIKVMYNSSQATEYVNMNRICKMIDQEGKETNLEELNNFIHAGGLNKITSLILRDKYTQQIIRVADIKNMKLTRIFHEYFYIIVGKSFCY